MGMSARERTQLLEEVERAPGMVSLPAMWIREILGENKHLEKEMLKFYDRSSRAGDAARKLAAELIKQGDSLICETSGNFDAARKELLDWINTILEEAGLCKQPAPSDWLCYTCDHFPCIKGPDCIGF